MFVQAAAGTAHRLVKGEYRGRSSQPTRRSLKHTTTTAERIVTTILLR